MMFPIIKLIIAIAVSALLFSFAINLLGKTVKKTSHPFLNHAFFILVVNSLIFLLCFLSDLNSQWVNIYWVAAIVTTILTFVASAMLNLLSKFGGERAFLTVCVVVAFTSWGFFYPTAGSHPGGMTLLPSILIAINVWLMGILEPINIFFFLFSTAQIVLLVSTYVNLGAWRLNMRALNE